MAKVIHLDQAIECEFCGDLTDEVIDYGNMICQDCYEDTKVIETEEDRKNDAIETKYRMAKENG